MTTYGGGIFISLIKKSIPDLALHFFKQIFYRLREMLMF